MNQGTLYIVATPIGNLKDFSHRGITVLQAVSVVAAEDTRVTRKLLSAYEIETPMISYHEHNETERTKALVERLLRGEDVALVSDAGTPLISDPGFPLVRECRQQGIKVTTVPGPCALIAALSTAGLPTDRFVFEGFLPSRQAARKSRLEACAADPRTLVFYESVHRLISALRDMADCLGAERQAVVARELTKLHETVTADSLVNLVTRLAQDENSGKGEAVIVIAGCPADVPVEQDIDTVLKPLLAELPLKQAVKLAVAISGSTRNLVYARALALNES